jgi:hypothetical protein
MPKSDNASRINDVAWQKICDGTNLLQSIAKTGSFRISANELKVLSEQEQPRLLVKFDFDFQRPKIFKINKLNILPLKRGSYIVYHDPENRTYCDLQHDFEGRRPKPYQSSTNLENLDTLAKGVCSSESDAIQLALLSSLLSHFTGLKDLVHTKGGKFGSKEFMVKLPGSGELILVDKSQMEVDGIFESVNSNGILLVEAKIGFHTNFHIRQLVYPYIWLKSQSKKRIIPLLLCYSGGEFRLTEFAIGEHFGDVKVVRQEYFVIEKYGLSSGDIATLTRFSASPKEMLDVPFPQADDMDMVIDVVRLVNDGRWSKEKFVEVFGYVPRQADYYLNAARYLGFVNSSAQISEDGRNFLAEKYRINRTEIILRRMLSRPALREAISLLGKHNNQAIEISVNDLKSLVDKHRPGEYSAETLLRRAMTVKCWLRWLVANCDLPFR